MRKYYFILFILLFVACTTFNKVQVIDIPQQVSVWVNDTKDFWEDNNFFYYKSVVDIHDMNENGEKISLIYAKNTVAEQIKQQIKLNYLNSKFESTVKYSSKNRDTFISKVNGLLIEGIEVVDRHKQKIIISHRGGFITNYRYYCLVRISKNQYQKAIINSYKKWI